MSLVKKLGRRIVSCRAPKNKLERELFYLRRKRKKVEKTIKWLNKRIPVSRDYEYYQYHLYLNEEKWLRQIQMEYYLECKIVRIKYGFGK